LQQPETEHPARQNRYKNQVKESDFTKPSDFVTLSPSKPTPSGQPGCPAQTAATPEVQMKANDTGPLAEPRPEPLVIEMIRQSLNGLIPASPDLMALFDRMEMPR
jgi:hypothetical protein